MHSEETRNGLIQAARTLEHLGRADSAIALLQATAQGCRDTALLRALQKTAERGQDLQTAQAALQQLEDILGPHSPEMDRIRSSRHICVDSGWNTGTPRIAGIMDEFTAASFAPECVYLPLDPHRSIAQLTQFRPALVFVESAWHGSGGAWNRMISTPAPPLTAMLDWCRQNGIPSVFWNKEDPVHFHTFLAAARLCDFVFTTDLDRIPAYKDALGHERIHFLPFAAQPQMHNPVAAGPRKDAFNFAGSYYLRYPERQRDLATMVETARALRPVEIYDRHHGQDHPHYAFPDTYRPMILGALPFSAISAAYKSYRYGININTIKQSQTMFARRVYELMASNTVVASNFSRGQRMLFGDLTICSDQPARLSEALNALTADDTRYRKFRLLGLRKVLQEHSYAARLCYVLAKVTGRPFAPSLPAAALIAAAATAEEAGRLTAAFRAQAHRRKHLFLLAPESHAADGSDVSVFRGADSLLAAFEKRRGEFAFVGCLDPADFYGEHYLTDLLLAPRYSDAEGFSKGCHFQATGKGAALQDANLRYSYTRSMRLAAGLLRSRHLTGSLLADCLRDPTSATAGDLRILAIDEFNYCRNGAADSASQALARDMELPGQGAPLGRFYDIAEALPAAKPRPRPQAAPALTAAEFCDEAILPANKPLAKHLQDGRLVITSRQDSITPAEIWMARKYPRAALNLERNSWFRFSLERSLPQGQLICRYYDSSGREIGHSLFAKGGRHALALPEACTQVRFGLRLCGAGTLALSDLTFGDQAEFPPVIAGRSGILVLTKQYPSSGDLYKYGFLHSRIRGYRRQGLEVDVFRLNPSSAAPYDEFENIDVATGDAALLDATLRSGRYGHVLVHLQDPEMWEVLKKHLHRIRVTIWIHGAEIQHWRRRAFEFPRLSAAQVERKKQQAGAYLDMWREVFSSPEANLHLVFVSRSLLEEATEDVGRPAPQGRHSVIHNYIDGEIFRHVPKSAEDRFRLLSIRPYAGRKYANDLTAAAITVLSRRPGFDAFAITIAGGGPDFEAETEALRHFPNVTLREGFLTHAEIAALHRGHGVFLTPTRWDSQGVSRDEAMASGLVPVSTRTAAVPEFMDEGCGILTPPEDAAALAEAIESLSSDPDLFLRLSQAAAARVRAQSGFQNTIAREIALIRTL
ncbi:glycosyltransferase family protein [Cribrihabitans neustonicus]|uniref:glycosyltransferase family protein n=1 Tax=Cribrihabitans neustonicus TaxID=1429085 RepID=UPI003B5C5324